MRRIYESTPPSDGSSRTGFELQSNQERRSFLFFFIINFFFPAPFWTPRIHHRSPGAYLRWQNVWRAIRISAILYERTVGTIIYYIIINLYLEKCVLYNDMTTGKYRRRHRNTAAVVGYSVVRALHVPTIFCYIVIQWIAILKYVGDNVVQYEMV